MCRFARKAFRRFGRFISLLFSVVILLQGCSGPASDKMALSDLGGVYSSSFSDLDLEVEISGILSEGKSAISSTRATKIQKEKKKISNENKDKLNENLSNKLLCWGISRRPDNQVPAADPGAPELLKKYGGLYLGDVSKKVIYLTFDEGYENGYTAQILDTLRDNGVKAVFFITGPYLSGQQELVRRMVEEGHYVGNHSIHHPSLPGLDDKQLEEELLGLDRAFNEKFGENMDFLRPPKGEYSERTLALTEQLGYCNLFWSFAYDDWYRDKIRGSEYARNIVMRNLHNGAVILLHAVSKDNAEALDSIIKGAEDKGYIFGDPKELLSPEKAEE